MNDITPDIRYQRALEDGHLVGDVFTMDDHHRAFHRAVVDHYVSLGLQPIEGFRVARQAEIICDELTSLKRLAF